MKLRELHLDELVVIPGALDIAGGMPVKREQSFHVDDGWDLREVLPGIFSITRAEMPHAVTIGGFGYSYVPAPPEPTVERPPVANEMTLQTEQAQMNHAQANQNALAAQQHHRKGKR